MSKNILIIDAGGQIPQVLIPLLQEKPELHLTLFGRHAADLPYTNVTKVSGDSRNLTDLIKVMKNQDAIYMNFDAHNRGVESLEVSDLDYTYMRMTWLYNGNRKDYIASPKGEPFLGAQITRRAIAQFIMDNITGKRNDIRASIGLWEPGSENKSKGNNM